MLDKIRDLLDRIPRPGELDTRGRVIAGVTGVAVLALVVVLALWGAGVFGGSTTDTAEEGDGLPYGDGIVSCERFPADSTPEEDALLTAVMAEGTGLPYRANLGDVRLFTGNYTNAIVSICMEPDATREQITDTATVIARNIKTHYAGQAEISGLTVRYLGTGNIPLKDAITYFDEHTFSKDVPVQDQRSAWEWDDSPEN